MRDERLECTQIAWRQTRGPVNLDQGRRADPIIHDGPEVETVLVGVSESAGLCAAAYIAIDERRRGLGQLADLTRRGVDEKGLVG